MDPKQLKKAATDAAKAATKTAEDHNAQVDALAEQINTLSNQYGEALGLRQAAQSRAKAAAILARIADTDLMPAILGEQGLSATTITSLCRRGLMYRKSRSIGPFQTHDHVWLDALRNDVVALYRELTATAED